MTETQNKDTINAEKDRAIADRFKFRAWDKDLKSYWKHGCFNLQKACEDKSLIVEQCTGIKDKNGKLIYEGDLVKTDNWFLGKPTPDEIAVIEWNSRYARYDISTKTDEYDFSFYDSHDVEIIGNVHENPELLEGK